MGDATADAGSTGPLDRGSLQRFRAEVIGQKNLPTIPAVLARDVGRLILGARFKDAYWTAGAEPVRSIVDVEQAAFGVQHAEVGGWLLEAWGLPLSIVEAARLHHAAPDRSGITALVAATNRLVAATDVAERRLRPEAADALAREAARGVTPELWDVVIAALAEDGALDILGRVEA